MSELDNNKMNPEIKAQWVAELRSGNFVQGTGVLHTKVTGGPDTFCCLGVLCELAVAAGVVDRIAPDDGRRAYAYTPTQEDEHSSATHYLSRHIGDWAGMEHLNPELKSDGRYHYVADLNDGTATRSDALTFPEIADLIEEQL